MVISICVQVQTLIHDWSLIYVRISSKMCQNLFHCIAKRKADTWQCSGILGNILLFGYVVCKNKLFLYIFSTVYIFTYVVFKYLLHAFMYFSMFVIIIVTCSYIYWRCINVAISVLVNGSKSNTIAVIYNTSDVYAMWLYINDVISPTYTQQYLEIGFCICC